MAGEAILANIVTEILKKVGSFALEEINLSRSVKKELEKLKKTILMIEAVISDAENKQVKEKFVGIWLKELKDLAYEADDILDEYAYDIMHRQGLNRKRDKVRNFVSFRSNPVVISLKRERKIKNLNQKFGELERRKVGLGLKEGSSSITMVVDGSHGINHRETYAFVDESKVLGREVDKSNIINMLLANNSSSCNQNDKISVIPIVGMGGLGKTTLAQLVYKDTVVESHFDLRIWVCVSDVFDVKKIFLNMIPDANIGAGSNLNFIVSELQQRLGGKKFLLVLDDVWNENALEWDKLKVPLVVGAAEGSKILVTTRSEKVASIVQVEDSSSYKLQTLGDEICLSIFEQRAFGPSCKAIKTQTLMEIGKQLVRKCDGLPLALEALGSLMHSMKEVREWEVIRDSKIWDNNPENPNKILPALKLSYDHLLPQVKPCFSYCSMFPKDWMIVRETLIRLWVAEGFIRPFEGDERLMEEIGNGYFNNLLWNSFFQGVTNEDGEITRFKMHDLIHDLAQSVAGTHECSIMEASEMRDISEFRRLKLLNVNEESSAAIATVVSKSKIRTLFIQLGRIANYDSLLNNNKRLRVLDLSWNSNIEELPPSIGDLKHLRYLDLTYCRKLKKLPDSITRLYNLQTLNLEGCPSLEEFPNDLNKLINLRHLLHEVSDWQLKVGQLTCLQTLSGFGVPAEDNGGDSGGGGIGELQFLNLLGGKLEITRLERVRGRANAEKANLKAKKYIKELELNWGGSGVEVAEDEDNNNNHSLVLEGLQPHPNLKSLQINGFMGPKFPTWMNRNLQNLVHLQLWNCKRCKQLPALPSLRFIEIEDMELLEEWQQLDQPLPPLCNIVSSSASSSSSSYRSLESIKIEWCPKLKSMPTKFFSLKEFTVWETSNGMVSSIVRSNLDTLTKLVIEGVDGLEFLPLVGLLKANNVLESLEIRSCRDFKGFNNREEEGDEDLLLLSSSSSSSLHTLKLLNCPNLTLLPGNLRGLTSLRKLVVKNCERIEICPILKNMLTGFPSMEDLSLENTGLVFLPLVGLLKSNNVLKSLSINNCPDFQGFIQQEEEEEEEEEGDEDLLLLRRSSSSSSSSSSLHTLELHNLPNLTLLPGNLRGLTSLRKLVVKKCESIEICPILKNMLTGFPSVEELSLEKTPRLVFLPLVGLLKGNNVLKSLRISNCPDFQGFIQEEEEEGDEDLSVFSSSNSSSLRGLYLIDCPVLRLLPDLKDFTSLRELELRNCPVLRLLPDLKDLTSLYYVRIEGCHEDLVISLPSIFIR